MSIADTYMGGKTTNSGGCATSVVPPYSPWGNCWDHSEVVSQKTNGKRWCCFQCVILNDRFTKTGLGQTKGNIHQKKDTVLYAQEAGAYIGAEAHDKILIDLPPVQRCAQNTLEKLAVEKKAKFKSSSFLCVCVFRLCLSQIKGTLQRASSPSARLWCCSCSTAALSTSAPSWRRPTARWKPSTLVTSNANQNFAGRFL